MKRMKRMKRRRLELLPAAGCVRVQRKTVDVPQLCTEPGLRAAVPPYRSAARCGSWSTARCAPGPDPGPGSGPGELLRQEAGGAEDKLPFAHKNNPNNKTLKQI